jgi:hypothetical protein
MFHYNSFREEKKKPGRKEKGSHQGFSQLASGSTWWRNSGACGTWASAPWWEKAR